LLADCNGHPFTLERLQPGAIFGLASLLRAAPCKEVSAASAAQAAVLPDRLILELHATSGAFRAWSGAQLWPAELQKLLAVLQANTAQRLDADQQRQRLTRSSGRARLVAAEPGGGGGVGRYRRRGGAGGGQRQPGWSGDRNRAAPHRSPALARPPLPARLIALPAVLLGSSPTPGPTPEAAFGEEGRPAEAPLATSLDLG
jgi:ATP-binding cassette subfamily B protein